MAARYSLLRLALGASSLALLAAGGAHAQEMGPPSAAPAQPDPVVEFEALELSYDENVDVVTATGQVVMRHEGQNLFADKVVYDRRSGKVLASGNVLLQDAGGSRMLADDFELTESLKDGVIQNLLVVLADGSRLAAHSAVRADGLTTLNGAAYTPCAVLNEEGCPIKPVWQIQAVRVVHDPVRGRVYYSGARLQMFGVPLMIMPKFSHPDSFDKSQTGLLQPDFQLSRELGGEIRIPYLWSIAPDKDLTVAGHIYTNVRPVVSAEYRQLLAGGPIQLKGWATYAEGRREDPVTGNIVETGARLRGAIEGAGQIEHGNGWRSSYSARLTNDDNFLGRYQITLETRLRSTYALERFEDRADIGQRYFGVSGWYFQNLTQEVSAASVPVALPLVDFRWRLPHKPLGGNLLLNVNSLALYRKEGQSMARAVASAQWDRSLVTRLGQRVTLTGLLRADLYNSSDGLLADDPIYAGSNGWATRAIPLAAVDVEWPLAGEFLGGSQTLTPRVQMVATTATSNADIPNEDARAIDLEDTNLFSLNRFPGYDRWESGTRVTYGVDWRWNKPGLAVHGQIGQSYRLSNKDNLFPDGTGLSGRTSDIVARGSVRVGRYVELTQRLRLDKDNLAVRRNETDIAIGSRQTFVSVGYSKYNRNIDLEDLTDHEELRAGARLAFGKYWAVFGSTVVDMTSKGEDPQTLNDGWQPVRHRLGISYTDECFEFGLSWKRNYMDNPNAREGNTFQFSVKLRNLG